MRKPPPSAEVFRRMKLRFARRGLRLTLAADGSMAVHGGRTGAFLMRIRLKKVRD